MGQIQVKLDGMFIEIKRENEKDRQTDREGKRDAITKHCCHLTNCEMNEHAIEFPAGKNKILMEQLWV